MLFNSFEFVLFFPLVVGAFYACPHRWRWALLLAASYLFYGWWRADYLALIAASTLVDYWSGRRMGARATRRERRPYLLLSLGSNLGLLSGFKYLGFFGETANTFLALASRDPVAWPDVLLPVGISFYTFQTLSYAIDVYRGEVEPERHLGVFALYVSFFPQLVAGPIERSRRLLPQFHREQTPDPARIGSGLRLMLWGFFVKCVVADRLGPYVDAVYSAPELYSGLAVWTSSWAFAWQIYGDFAGYSLIAIGAARVLGFRLMDNFRRPFLARSLDDLWRRWHISLMSWFRDYVYRPLGGGRRGRAWGLFNLLVVFAVSGLWHGAAWTFVLFGVVEGLLVIVGRLTAARRAALWDRLEALGASSARPAAAGPRLSVPAVRRVVGAVVAFNGFALIAPFFRGASLSDALLLYSRLLHTPAGTHASPWLPGFDATDLALIVAAVGALLAVDILEERGRSLDSRLMALPPVGRWTAYLGLTLVVLLFGSYGEQPFLYFQF